MQNDKFEEKKTLFCNSHLFCDLCVHSIHLCTYFTQTSTIPMTLLSENDRPRAGDYFGVCREERIRVGKFPEDFHPVFAKMRFQSSTFKRGKCNQPPCYFFLHCLANSTEIYVFHLYFAKALPECCILLQQTEWQAS